MEETLLEIKNLNKSFKDKGIIFDDLNLKIYRKKHLALVAKNGVGKTVLLETIAGLRKYDSGEIKWNSSFKITPYEKIGFLFQKDNLTSYFYVEDYIKILQIDKNIDNNFLEHLLNIFDFRKLLSFKIFNLSGEQKQVLKIIITFVYKYEIIILDEFDNNLDIQIKNQLLNFIKYYAKEYDSTIILVSHDLEDIKQICSQIAFLNNGKIKDIKSAKQMTLEKFKNHLIAN